MRTDRKPAGQHPVAPWDRCFAPVAKGPQAWPFRMAAAHHTSPSVVQHDSAAGTWRDRDRPSTFGSLFVNGNDRTFGNRPVSRICADQADTTETRALTLLPAENMRFTFLRQVSKFG